MTIVTGTYEATATGAANGTSAGAATGANATDQLYEMLDGFDGDTIEFTSIVKDAQSQKDKINSAISGQGLKAKRDQVSGVLKALKDELARIEKELQVAKDNLKKAQEDLEKATNEIEKLIALREEEQKRLEALEEEYKNYENDYKEVAKQISNLNDKMGGITGKIEEYTNRLNQETKDAQQKALWEALHSYNEEEDGPYEDYIASKLGEIAPSGELSGLIEFLTGQSSTNMKRMAGLQIELKAYDLSLTETQGKIEASRNLIVGYTDNIANNERIQNKATNDIATNETNIAAMETKQKDYPARIDQLEKQLSDYDYLISSDFKPISDEEWKFVEDNNIDLAEKMSNGKPRYVIAPGVNDKQYHIYDMSQDGWAIVRKMADKGGYDIIEKGNGHLYDYHDKESGDGRVVFFMDDCDNLSYDNACYKTASPLAFDLNGDGVKTSGTIINFDIDGDGVIDNIYDAADAILVFDADGDGVAGESGLEVFGNNTDLDGDGKADGYKDGFEALKALAYQEGLIGENDDELNENDLKVLSEKYGLGIKVDGYNSETASLAGVGITNINLSATNDTTLIDNFDGNGNQLMTQEGATFTYNGEERAYADIWHRKLDKPEENFFTLSQNAQLPEDLYELQFINNLKITQELLGVSDKAVLNAQDINEFSQRTIQQLERNADSVYTRMLAAEPEDKVQEQEEKPLEEVETREASETKDKLEEEIEE